MSERMMLGLGLGHSHTNAKWRRPGAWTGYSYYTDPAYYADVARLAERGRFDFAFFGENAETPDTYLGSFDNAVRYGIEWPRHEMLPYLPLMAAATKDLGFVCTMSTTYQHPFYLARLMSSLDHVTRGRIAWNVVTGARLNEARNYGFDQLPPPAERYRRATEFVEVCFKLWDSVPAEAMVLDPETGVVADPDRVSYVDHAGEHFRVKGPLPGVPGPQGRPAICQAGQSPDGIALAARFADFQLGSRIHPDDMARHRSRLDEALRAVGRDPLSVPIMWGVSTMLGDTRAAAERRYEAYLASLPPGTGLTFLSKQFAFDFGQVPERTPVADIADEIRAAGGMIGYLEELLKVDGADGSRSLEDIGRRAAMGSTAPVLLGTPEQIADRLTEMFEAFDRNGGFVVSCDDLPPQSIAEFMDTVVPVLQRRGLVWRDYDDRTFLDRMRTPAGERLAPMVVPA